MGSCRHIKKQVVGLATALALGACGHPAAPEVATHQGEAQGAEREREDTSGLSVTGLLGTLSQYEIQNALDPRMPKFSRCVQRRSGEVEWISGGVEFQFRVALDGSVARVYPSQSSMGDRETERCMLDVAKGTRFPAPHGGEAEFSWSLEVPLDPDVRAPIAWGAPDVGDALLEAIASLKSQCGEGPYRVTAYVDAGGKVVAAGVATSDEGSAESLDCVAQQVQSLALASPGSYAAKLSFDVE